MGLRPCRLAYSAVVMRLSVWVSSLRFRLFGSGDDVSIHPSRWIVKMFFEIFSGFFLAVGEWEFFLPITIM